MAVALQDLLGGSAHRVLVSQVEGHDAGSVSPLLLVAQNKDLRNSRKNRGLQSCLSVCLVEIKTLLSKVEPKLVFLLALLSFQN